MDILMELEAVRDIRRLMGRVTGRPALIRWLRHIMTNDVVVDTPTTAHGSLDMILLTKKEDAWLVLAAPRDGFVKTANSWKFAERSISAKG